MPLPTQPRITQPQPTVRRAQPLVTSSTPARPQPPAATTPQVLAAVAEDTADDDSLDTDQDSSSDDSSSDNETVDLSSVETDSDGDTTDDDDDLDVPDADSAVVQIFKPECLKCGHLVSFEEHLYKKCHFTAGNTSCPAQGVQIQIQIPLDRIVRSFMRAEESGDAKKLATLYQALATKPDWAQRQIQAALAQARAAKTARSK